MSGLNESSPRPVNLTHAHTHTHTHTHIHTLAHAPTNERSHTYSPPSTYQDRAVETEQQRPGSGSEGTGLPWDGHGPPLLNHKKTLTVDLRRQDGETPKAHTSCVLILSSKIRMCLKIPWPFLNPSQMANRNTCYTTSSL